MSKRIIPQYSKKYDINQAKYFYTLKSEHPEYSYNYIAMDPELNPKRLKPQRIQAIVKEYIAKFGETEGGDSK